MISFNIAADILSDDNSATIAQVSFRGGDGDLFKAIGAAKVCKPDKYDESIGDALALGRALKKLGQELIRDAYDEVHEIDKEREARLAAQAEQNAKREAARYNFECEYAALIKAKSGAMFEEVQLEKTRQSKMIRTALGNIKLNVGDN